MKITKNITKEFDVTVELTSHDIEVIYLEAQPLDLGVYLKQLNDVAIFLNGTSSLIISQLSRAQAETIAVALAGLADRMIRENAFPKADNEN